jgi:hypothetical protein
MDDGKGRRTDKPKPVRINRKRDAPKRKTTLVLTTANDQRLSVLAALTGRDRSTLVNEYLDIALASVEAQAMDTPPRLIAG